jgi:hypothetical protein
VVYLKTFVSSIYTLGPKFHQTRLTETKGTKIENGYKKSYKGEVNQQRQTAFVVDVSIQKSESIPQTLTLSNSYFWLSKKIEANLTHDINM